MNTSEALHGMNCPKCGGMVPVPEGQVIVKCPFCELRSYVRGQRGLLRYQVPQRVERKDLQAALVKFLKSNMAIAPVAARQAELSEAFLVHLPFWTAWGRVAAWVFGEKEVGSSDHKHYEPREVRVVSDMTWNGPACDVGEFGVRQVPLLDQNLMPFNADALHHSGMVFEAVNSVSEAQQAAESQFGEQVKRSAGLDRLSQVFMRSVRRRLALVYHPLWVLRYTFRQRIFQVVIDANTGQVLYGKAPGNTVYRAGMLVLGMAVGAFVAIDIPAGILSNSNGDNSGGAALALLVAGIGIMFTGYRLFRRGEQYEYRWGNQFLAGKKGGDHLGEAVSDLLSGTDNPMNTLTSVKDIEKWIDRLN
jgi:hypothetical protein